jgi:hypothetical protein
VIAALALDQYGGIAGADPAVRPAHCGMARLERLAGIAEGDHRN